ncbi:hypothetical protein EJ05DRAFT_61493 [Pseudovirgaria hyperparasitica]|uniref:Uncharacterized protein n=1 Tax=Pseudovirgaria hyperparasitica TaxID=470096 RepID=A0A6A6W418_9PEZI|nr:uncharacterized protein EJ05DRAFT_61493 [Pseudovirgaria hyperparasitica]KAF2756307.1 hypothetical protein EJ05DRAFT_61493 [Pseudovirgaria hyperparasitica]
MVRNREICDVVTWSDEILVLTVRRTNMVRRFQQYSPSPIAIPAVNHVLPTRHYVYQKFMRVPFSLLVRIKFTSWTRQKCIDSLPKAPLDFANGVECGCKWAVHMSQHAIDSMVHIFVKCTSDRTMVPTSSSLSSYSTVKRVSIGRRPHVFAGKLELRFRRQGGSYQRSVRLYVKVSRQSDIEGSMKILL